MIQNPADPAALAASIERKRKKALERDARQKAARADADMRLSKLTSISGTRQAASPKFGSHPSKKKKHKH